MNAACKEIFNAFSSDDKIDAQNLVLEMIGTTELRSGRCAQWTTDSKIESKNERLCAMMYIFFVFLGFKCESLLTNLFLIKVKTQLIQNSIIFVQPSLCGQAIYKITLSLIAMYSKVHSSKTKKSSTK